MDTAGFPVVVKASGLAAGKGVVVPQNKVTALLLSIKYIKNINSLSSSSSFSSSSLLLPHLFFLF